MGKSTISMVMCNSYVAYQMVYKYILNKKQDLTSPYLYIIVILMLLYY